MVLLFIGPSGSGKDTQADLLKERKSFEVVSTGKLLRDISNGQSDIQNRIVEDMNDGFSQDGLIFGLLEVYLKRSKLDNFVLTGAVRRASQVELLDTALLNVGYSLDKVVYFELADQEAAERLVGRMIDPATGKIYHPQFNPPSQEILGRLVKRTDDAEVESLLKRLRAFYTENEAIIREYEQRGILLKINASQSIEDIHTELLNKLNL
jgi:adenylate kinase